MDNAPTYDPDVPRSWYDRFGDKEWTRPLTGCWSGGQSVPDTVTPNKEMESTPLRVAAHLWR